VALARFGALGALSALIATSPAVAEESPRLAWSDWVGSPVWLDEARLGSLERQALARCGPGEARLADTARAVVEARLLGHPLPEFDTIALLQRAAGEPHPWARAWLVAAHDLDSEASLAELDAWLGAPGPESRRRCGVAVGTGADGSRVLAVVAVDALADLTPLPVRVRAGQWLTVEARLRVHARGGSVLVLGPSGAPRRLPTTFDGVKLRARFAPERPGEFAVQVMADLESGSRPVLEATLFADCEPPDRSAPRPAPGEESGATELAPDAYLASLMSAARASVGLAPLARDPRLDRVAHEHAMRVARAQQLVHDTGDGDPSDRLRAAGVDATYLGENVAHAKTVALAHRAVWASPSHRSNLLRREFQRAGAAVVYDDHGEAWIVETFAGP
jgi:uncharacterized protein YkwD